MKKDISFVLLLIIAFLFISGCRKNTDDHLPEVSASRLPSPSAAPSPAGSITSQHYYIVEKNGRKGAVNECGQVVLPFEYSKIDILYYYGTPVSFFAVPAAVKTGGQISSDYNVFLFDLDGIPVYKDKYSYPFPYAYTICNGLIVFYSNKKCGVLSYKGEEVIPFRYDYISMCGDYIVAAAGNLSNVPGNAVDVDVYNKSGSLQNSGEISFTGINDNLITVTDYTGTKFGLVDTRFKEVVPAEWDELNSLGSGLFVARREEKCGVIDGHGKEVIPVKYNSVNRCYDSGDPNSMILSASDEAGVYIFDGGNKQLFFSDRFISVTVQNGVILAVDRLNMCHCINQEGEDIIPPAQSIYANESGLIICSSPKGKTYYTKEGIKLPLPESDSIYLISPERFIFILKDKWIFGICDAGGGIIVPAEYTFLYPCYDNNDLIIFNAADKSGKARCGIIDPDGSILLDGFGWLAYAGGGLFYADKGVIHGLIDINGNWIWQTSDYATLMD